MDIPPLSAAPLQVSTSALISTLHQTFTNTHYRSLRIDSTSAVYLGATIEDEFVTAVWDHAHRRAEDQALFILPTHPASPTVFLSALSAFPNSNPAVIQALNVLSPFLTALTPANISTRFHNGLGASLSLNSKGDVVASRISLSKTPFSSLDQLLHLPPKAGNRVFDVFYHLLLGESENYGPFLALKDSPDLYTLLNRSKTYQLPDWVTFSDDYALAKDWSDGLRQCGIKGATLRGVLSTLSGILLLGNSSDPTDVAEGASLIGIDPTVQKRYTTDQLITATYNALVENVVVELNNFLASFDAPEEEVVSVVTIVECTTAKGVILNNVFDNSIGINSELSEDGFALPKSPASVVRALKSAQSQSDSTPSIDLRSALDPSVSYVAGPVTSKSAIEADGEQPLDVAALSSNTRIWNILNVSASSDARGQADDTWSSGVVSSQIREFFVTEWAQKRRTMDFTADFGFEEFLEKYQPIMPPSVGFYELESWAREKWAPTEFYRGSNRIWLSEGVWRALEMGLEGVADPAAVGVGGGIGTAAGALAGAGAAAGMYEGSMAPSRAYAPEADAQPTDQLLPTSDRQLAPGAGAYGGPDNPFSDNLLHPYHGQPGVGAGVPDPYDSDDENDMELYNDDYVRKYHDDIEVTGAGAGAGGKDVKSEVKSMTGERRAWLWFVWLWTFWIPSPFLKLVLRMKRQQVRIAFREKLVICALITLFNAGIIFYMIFLGRLVCPDFDKVWNAKQLSTHQGTNDFYVGIWGNVYDITNFYRQQHSDLPGITTNAANMMEFAGLDLSEYFYPPLTVACPGLVNDQTVQLPLNTTLAPNPLANHASGPKAQPVPTTALHNITWFNDVFKPAIKKYYKGRLVETTGWVSSTASKQDSNLIIIGNMIYNLDSYFQLISTYPSASSPAYAKYNFFPSTFVDMVQNNQGKDLTQQMQDKLDPTTRSNIMQCLDNTFLSATIDFRYSARCQVANYILVTMAGVLTGVTVIKFLASIRFGSKKMPSPQDKFVVCQIPAYTESEEALRLAIDSLTSLKYDNRRKLLFVICDGMIVGSGNDRPTPRIVLDLFGVDEKVDPPKLPYYSIGEGANRLNYAQVYSGLYENEGYIVPYIVVVKVGRPDENSRPGNRGKRDSQILLMNFFNRVQYQRPMNAVELEVFHQLNNVVGVDPELYEYILMVDADTSVREDALTRLVAACSNDAKIAGTCGETSLQNEEQSWTTMIQVYEYFISHHLTKAFESLFGSVTCLPGCFSLYRMRTSKKSKPIIISDEVIRDYSVLDIDTLHKKNLFSLGEDRYLTTLLTKHFPKMKLTFVADAHAYTAAPDELSVLLSQRRRWINSTVHNLVELLRLDNMCGFLFVGMRGIVFIDLIGTIMLPSVVVYLAYLIYVIASHTGPLPLISIILIASVYGIQMLVFIMRRQWQHIGWMIFYLLAYPIHSFLLPIYSFWNMDNFSWGNTRVVVEEKGRQHVLEREDGFDPTVVQEETWHSYATRLGLPGAERTIVFHERKGRMVVETETGGVGGVEYGYDMQELTPYGKSVFDDPSIYDHASFQDRADDRRSEYRASRSFTANLDRPHSQMASSRMSAYDRMSVAPSMPSIQPSMPAPSVYQEAQDGAISDTIRTVLKDADLENMTKRQLREKVEDVLGVQFQGDKIGQVDRMIDEELEKMDD